MGGGFARCKSTGKVQGRNKGRIRESKKKKKNPGTAISYSWFSSWFVIHDSCLGCRCAAKRRNQRFRFHTTVWGLTRNEPAIDKGEERGLGNTPCLLNKMWGLRVLQWVFMTTRWDVLGRGRSKIIKFLGPSTRVSIITAPTSFHPKCGDSVHTVCIVPGPVVPAQVLSTNQWSTTPCAHVHNFPKPSRSYRLHPLPQSSSSPSPSSSSPPLLPHPKSFYSITTGPSSESFRPIITLPHSISRSSHEI